MAPLESTWISDAVLAAAFERYCAVSNGARRALSSVPGPLEGTRRLGKRRIAGLNAAYTPTSLPEWTLPEPLDLSKWKWEPPTLFSARRDHGQEQVADQQQEPALAGGLGWLPAWFPTSAPRPLVEEAPEEEADLLIQPATPLESLDGFRLLVQDQSLLQLEQACEDLCLQLSGYTWPVSNEILVVESLGGILEDLNASFGSSPDALTIFAKLYSAVIPAVFDTRKRPQAGLNMLPFRGLLVQLTNLPAGDELCRLFEQTMKNFRQEQCAMLSTEIVAVLTKFLESWSGGSDLGRHNQAQIVGISNALWRLRPSCKAVFELVEQYLLEQSQPLEKVSHARISWLMVLSHGPRWSPKTILKLFTTLFREPPAAAAISNTDICELLLNTWRAGGRLRNAEQVKTLFQQLCAENGESTSIAALLTALFRLRKFQGEPHLRISELCACLKAVGRLEEIPASFRALIQHQVVHPRLLREVATFCGDHRVAVMLHNLYLTMDEPRKPKDQWDAGRWTKYLKTVFSDPAATPTEVMRILRRCWMSRVTARIAAKVAFDMAYSAHLSNRASYRNVSACIAFLRKNGERLPSEVLVSVYHVITRDLAEGEWGRTSRFELFLELIHSECGPETAKKCARMLRGWRQIVTLARYGRPREIVDELMEEEPVAEERAQEAKVTKEMASGLGRTADASSPAATA